MLISRLFNNRKNRYEISVIIPFHNVEQYIGESIESVLAQNGVSCEIIMVNDGSDDRSEEIVREYMKNHDNIRLHTIEHNGPGYARNYGVRFAEGEFISFLDADDKLMKGIYRRMIHAARNNDAEVCICNVARFNSERAFSSYLHDRVYKNFSTITSIRETPSLIYDTCSVNKLIKRDFYSKNDLTFPEHVVYEDISFNIDLHLKCSRAVMLAETGYLWRVREDQSNPSISQLHYSDKNINDRFRAAEWLAEHVLSGDAPDGLKRETQYRLLDTDLKVILDSVTHVHEEEALKTFERVISFVDRYISDEAMSGMPIEEIQRYRLVREGNVEGYKRLIDYHYKHYGNAAVEERDGELHAILPDDIFTVEKRSLNDEFARMIRETWMDDIKMTEDGLEISAHLYIRRYNMAHPDDQKLKIFLVNEENNSRIEIPYRPKETSFLTKRYGEVTDEATNCTAHYNYDWTGFTFTAGPELLEVESRYKRTKYSVIVEYSDRLFSGTQIIRYCNKTKKKEYESHIIRKNGKSMYMSFGKLDELQICVMQE